MTGTTLIKNGTILTAEEEYRGDILIRGEKISVIADEIIPEEDGTNGDKNKGENKKSTTEGNGSQ